MKIKIIHKRSKEKLYLLLMASICFFSIIVYGVFTLYGRIPTFGDYTIISFNIFCVIFFILNFKKELKNIKENKPMENIIECLQYEVLEK